VNVISNIRARKIPASFVIAVALCSTSAFTAAQSPESPAQQAASASTASLDFEYFKTRVAPILLKKRPGHGRCYACHSGVESTPSARDYLEKLPPGASLWPDEQLHRVFQRVSRLVVPGSPDKSVFLLRPLDPQAGGGPAGTSAHRGGRQFASKDDPDWKILAEWVQGAKAGK